jgi:Holliday junction resolvase RusA-like endonuclease
MTRTITLTIHGVPQAWRRARLGYGKRAHHYTDNGTRSAKQSVVWAFIKAAGGANMKKRTFFLGPVRLWVTAYFPIPKRTPKELRAVMETETVWYPHVSDWDNLGKLPSDALNGIAYKDDGQVVDGRVRKYYSPNPRVEIEITELTPTKAD